MEKMEKDEFKAAMRQAKVEEEVDALMKETEGVEDPDEVKPKRPRRPRKAAVENDLVIPETGKKRRKSPKTVSKRQKTVKISTKTSKTTPVAAGRKKPGPKPKNEADGIVEKAARRKEALQVAISIMTEKTDRIIVESGKMINLAELYTGYIETLEDMAE